MEDEYPEQSLDTINGPDDLGVVAQRAIVRTACADIQAKVSAADMVLHANDQLIATLRSKTDLSIAAARERIAGEKVGEAIDLFGKCLTAVTNFNDEDGKKAQALLRMTNRVMQIGEQLGKFVTSLEGTKQQITIGPNKVNVGVVQPPGQAFDSYKRAKKAKAEVVED